MSSSRCTCPWLLSLCVCLLVLLSLQEQVNAATSLRPQTAIPGMRNGGKRGTQDNLKCTIPASNKPSNWLAQTPDAKNQKFHVKDCSLEKDKRACMHTNYPVMAEFAKEVIVPQFHKLFADFYRAEKVANPSIYLFAKVGPVKAEQRTLDKAESDYGSDLLKVLDYTRGTIVFPTRKDLLEGICRFREFAQNPTKFHAVGSKFTIIREKDGLAGNRAGFEDYKMNVRFEAPHLGHSVCEIQFNYCAMVKTGNDHSIPRNGHVIYEDVRKLPKTETAKIEALLDESKKLYAKMKNEQCDMKALEQSM